MSTLLSVHMEPDQNPMPAADPAATPAEPAAMPEATPAEPAAMPEGGQMGA